MARETVSAVKEGGGVRFGGSLNAAQMEALKAKSPTGDMIFDNIDLLNEEIEESHPDFIDKSDNEPEEVEEELDMSDDLDNDLDSELDALAAKVSTPKAQPAEEEAPEPTDGEDALKARIRQILKKIPNAPSEKQIAGLKRKYGETGVHVFAASEKDVFIYTHLRRGQWQKIQEIMVKMQENGSQNIEELLKEKVLSHCVLWPRPLSVEFFAGSRAGLVDSIYQAIMMDSYFLNPQQIARLTVQL